MWNLTTKVFFGCMEWMLSLERQTDSFWTGLASDWNWTKVPLDWTDISRSGLTFLDWTDFGFSLDLHYLGSFWSFCRRCWLGSILHFPLLYSNSNLHRYHPCPTAINGPRRRRQHTPGNLATGVPGSACVSLHTVPIYSGNSNKLIINN